MAKYATIFVIIALFLVGSLTYYFSKESYLALPIQEEDPGVSLDEYNFQDWREFSSPHGTFKVLMPTLPQHASENVTDPNTNEVKKYNMYVAEKEDGTIFMINLITFEKPHGKADELKLMRAMMNDMVASNPNNELKEMQTGLYKGHESLDFAYGNTEMNIDAKTFMVGDTLYVLARLVKTENYNANEYNFFINSFDLVSPIQTPDN